MIFFKNSRPGLNVQPIIQTFQVSCSFPITDKIYDYKLSLLTSLKGNRKSPEDRYPRYRKIFLYSPKARVMV